MISWLVVCTCLRVPAGLRNNNGPTSHHRSSHPLLQPPPHPYKGERGQQPGGVVPDHAAGPLLGARRQDGGRPGGAPLPADPVRLSPRAGGAWLCKLIVWGGIVWGMGGRPPFNKPFSLHRHSPHHTAKPRKTGGHGGGGRHRAGLRPRADGHGPAYRPRLPPPPRARQQVRAGAWVHARVCHVLCSV